MVPEGKPFYIAPLHNAGCMTASQEHPHPAIWAVSTDRYVADLRVHIRRFKSAVHLRSPTSAPLVILLFQSMERRVDVTLVLFHGAMVWPTCLVLGAPRVST